MMKVKETVKALGVTFRHIFRKPVTLMYPEEKRIYPPRFRGTFALTTNPETGEENCIGCKLCENICPSKVITVVPEKRDNRNWAKEYTLDTNACMFCELCVQVCPTNAIVMLQFSEISASSRDELVLSKEKLLQNEKKYSVSWSTGERLRGMQSPPRKVKGEKVD